MIKKNIPTLPSVEINNLSQCFILVNNQSHEICQAPRDHSVVHVMFTTMEELWLFFIKKYYLNWWKTSLKVESSFVIQGYRICSFFLPFCPLLEIYLFLNHCLFLYRLKCSHYFRDSVGVGTEARQRVHIFFWQLRSQISSLVNKRKCRVWRVPRFLNVNNSFCRFRKSVGALQLL
jgi:hypothetical protein